MLLWGKLYKPDDPDTEVPVTDLIDQEIKPGRNIEIYSRSRSDSPAGFEGSVTIADAEGDVEIVNVYRNSPFSGTNEFKKTCENTDG